MIIKDMMPPMTCGKINQAIELVIESDLENYDKDLIIDSLERVRRDNIKLYHSFLNRIQLLIQSLDLFFRMSLVASYLLYSKSSQRSQLEVNPQYPQVILFPSIMFLLNSAGLSAHDLQPHDNSFLQFGQNIIISL
jgi:hypothetical protein